MQAIIIGAGRGSRLKALTDDAPKPYAPIGSRRILDWLLSSLRDAGIDKIVFVGGYRYDLVRADYPDLEFRHNPDWAQTNILASLMCAEDCMDEGFICTYADILYRPNVVRRAVDHAADAVVCVDTQWRTRYADRSQHPEDDAEKVIAQGDQILRINRTIESQEADGEYIGVARFNAAGASVLRQTYHELKDRLGDAVWKAETPFPRAYLIHLFEELLDRGHPLHMVTTDGEYMEVDTEEDFRLANEHWPSLYGMPTETERH
jgi:choline kinase